MAKAAEKGKVIEITVWARGVIGDKEGRDVANAFAKAAELEGKFTQAFDNYEDLPDRVLVPLRKYIRISDEEIQMKYLYTNDNPEVVVVMEPTIVKGIDTIRGLVPGGLLLINSNRPIDYLLNFIPNKDILGAIATIDATGITGVHTIDFSGSEGGIDATSLGAGISAPLLGALAKITGYAKKESLAKVVKDVAAMERGFSEVKVQKLGKASADYPWGK